MFDAVHHLSTSLRNAANQCDNFVKIIARHHPSAAATAFASNVGADFLALASGTGLAGLTGATTSLTSRKGMSKEERRALRKQRKLNRDPNAPKRPPSAYLLFQNEIREDMRQQYKDLSYSEVLGKISEAWKGLSEEQRKVYQDRTMDAMAVWNAAKRQPTGSAPAAGGYMGETTDDADAAAAGNELLASNGAAAAANPVLAAAAAAAPVEAKRKGKGEKRSRKNA